MKVGQKVVCIHDLRPSMIINGVPGEAPINGEIYTIRAIEDGRHPYEGDKFLLLNEIVNRMVLTKSGLFGEPSFCLESFRPVDEIFGEEIAEKLESVFIPLEIEEEVRAIFKICGVTNFKK